MATLVSVETVAYIVGIPAAIVTLLLFGFVVIGWLLPDLSDTLSKAAKELTEKIHKAEGKLSKAEGKLSKAEGKLSRAEVKQKGAQGRVNECKSECQKLEKEIEKYRSDRRGIHRQQDGQDRPASERRQ